MENSEYIQEKKRRQSKALHHWEEMQDRYATDSGATNENVGYSKWTYNVTDKSGTTLFSLPDSPLPHYYLYQSYFYELIATCPPYTIVPWLECSFYGDGIDLDYIEGLIYYYINLGALINSGSVLIDDIDGIIDFTSEVIITARIGERSIDASRIFSPCADIAGRFHTVKEWVARRRKSAGYSDVIDSDPIPTKNSDSKRTVGELCLYPFTPKDLLELLQSLRLLDTHGGCLTNNLRGKAQGARSKFTAAYRVLQRNKLMDATANDAEWANSFKEAYNAQIAEAARAYQLTAHGRAAQQSSKAFQTGVNEATVWVNAWKEKQSKDQ